MKKYKVSVKTMHESYNGYDLCDGWRDYEVEARNSQSAKNKALKIWKKEYHNTYWFTHTLITEL